MKNKIIHVLALALLAGVCLRAQSVNGVPVTTSGIELTANKDAASGYAGLDGSTRLKATEFPALTGDATSTAGGVATVVVAVNGTTVPTNAAADQVLNTTGSAVGAWKSIPNCTDSAGNHLNYTTATHAWSCGTSASVAGTVTSVSGTPNQVDVATGTTTPVISLDATILFPGIYKDKINTVTFSATPTFDLSAGNTQKITLTGNVTSSTASNHAAGERVDFLICQDSSGGHTLVWPTTVKGAPTIGTTLSTCTSVSFTDDGTNLYATGIGVTNM